MLSRKSDKEVRQYIKNHHALVREKGRLDDNMRKDRDDTMRKIEDLKRQERYEAKKYSDDRRTFGRAVSEEREEFHKKMEKLEIDKHRERDQLKAVQEQQLAVRSRLETHEKSRVEEIRAWLREKNGNSSSSSKK